MNERILLELFRALRERIPLDLRVVFISMHHKILGPLLKEEEIAAFESQFGLSYEEIKEKLNRRTRKKILDTLRRTGVWARIVTEQVESLIKGQQS